MKEITPVLIGAAIEDAIEMGVRLGRRIGILELQTDGRIEGYAAMPCNGHGLPAWDALGVKGSTYGYCTIADFPLGLLEMSANEPEAVRAEMLYLCHLGSSGAHVGISKIVVPKPRRPGLIYPGDSHTMYQGYHQDPYVFHI